MISVCNVPDAVSKAEAGSVMFMSPEHPKQVYDDPYVVEEAHGGVALLDRGGDSYVLVAYQDTGYGTLYVEKAELSVLSVYRVAVLG